MGPGAQANTAMRRIHSSSAKPAAGIQAQPENEVPAARVSQAASLPLPQARAPRDADRRMPQQPAVAAAKTSFSVDALVRRKQAATAQSTFALQPRHERSVKADTDPHARPAHPKQTAFKVAQAVGGVLTADAELAGDTTGTDAAPPVRRPSSRGERPMNKLIAEAMQARLAEEAAAEATRARLAAVSAAAAAARQRSAAALTPRKRPPPPSSVATSTAASSPVPSPPPARQVPSFRAAAGGSASHVPDRDPEATIFGTAAAASVDEETGHQTVGQAAPAPTADAAANPQAGVRPDATAHSSRHVGLQSPVADGLMTPIRRPLRPVDMAAAAASALLRQAIEGPKMHRQQGPTPTDSLAATPSLNLPPWTPAGESALPYHRPWWHDKSYQHNLMSLVVDLHIHALFSRTCYEGNN